MKHCLLILAACLALTGCSTMAASSHAEGQHLAHNHKHKTDCGHMAVAHAGHTDYLHDGHMHHEHGDHVDEHVMLVSAENPDGHNPVDHDKHDGHMHQDGEAMHAIIPHGDHMDFLHDGHLHHAHGDHVDEHGPLKG